MISVLSSTSPYIGTHSARSAGTATSAVGADQAQSDQATAVATERAPGASRERSETGLTAEQRVGAVGKADQVELTQEQRVIAELATRDREVRAHEQAHQAAGGGLTGAAHYDYQRGPDGLLYAVGGEVSVDLSPSSDEPAAVLAHAQAVIRAALAPAEPSGQDLAVAAQARADAAEAQADLITDAREAQQNEKVDVSELGVAEESDDADNASLTALADSGEESASADSPDAHALSRQALFEESQARREQQAEAVAAFQQQMADVQARLNEVQQRLVQVGVLDPQYLSGGLINEQA